MDETGGHYAKRNKPDMERQCKESLIGEILKTKTKTKQTKEHKHIETKCSVVAAGVCRVEKIGWS